MEITPMISGLEVQQNAVQQEAKPLKGFNFNSDVERFEQILFSQQQYLLKGGEPVEHASAPNAVSRIGKAFFEKTGKLKASSDKRLAEVMNRLNSTEQLQDKDLLYLQMQVGIYTVQNTFINNTADKIGEGIQMLFRNQ